MHNRHGWTQQREDGARREVRVVKQGGGWRFQAKTAGEQEWTYYDEVPLDDLAEFHAILLRKYQRRRAAYEDVLWAEREIARLKARGDEFGGSEVAGVREPEAQKNSPSQSAPGS